MARRVCPPDELSASSSASAVLCATPRRLHQSSYTEHRVARFAPERATPDGNLISRPPRLTTQKDSRCAKSARWLVPAVSTKSARRHSPYDRKFGAMQEGGSPAKANRSLISRQSPGAWLPTCCLRPPACDPPIDTPLCSPASTRARRNFSRIRHGKSIRNKSKPASG